MSVCLRNDKFWEYIPFFVKKNLQISACGIEILGYFPYHTAKIARTSLQIPRVFFADFEHYLYLNHIQDNKAVYICKPLSIYSGDCFAIMLKDNYALVRGWEYVTDYSGQPLKENQQVNDWPCAHCVEPHESDYCVNVCSLKIGNNEKDRKEKNPPTNKDVGGSTTEKDCMAT
jgi:hypothetical protein